MDLNNLLRNKNIALLSLTLLCILLLFLLIDDTRIIFLILSLCAAAALYAVTLRKKTSQPPVRERMPEETSSAYTPIRSDLTLADVAGLHEAKDELLEIKDFLNAPGRYKRFSARIPKGVLLVGPPGVGKTMIAKALAGEAGVPFFYQSGSSFVEIYVGMGAKKVHELFKTAKRNAPSIIFIDEIDSVGKARGGNRNDEREATLNQLLTEMDGFDSGSGVVVLAATNRVEMLDSALLRAGRFDRHVHLSLPSVIDRESILEIYLKKRPNNADIKKLAFITSGFSGATLENLVNEASLHAIRNNKDRIETEDFMAVKDKVLFGKKQQALFSVEEKEKIALYQSAKAVAAKELGLLFEKITLFENSFIPDTMTIESDAAVLHKIAAQISGIVAYDLQFGMRYNNIQPDIQAAETAVRHFLQQFNLEKSSDYESVLLQAKEIAVKTYKANKKKIESLQQDLLIHEVIPFNAI